MIAKSKHGLEPYTDWCIWSEQEGRRSRSWEGGVWVDEPVSAELIQDGERSYSESKVWSVMMSDVKQI